MKKLIEPEVDYADILAEMKESSRRNFIVTSYKTQARGFRLDASRLGVKLDAANKRIEILKAELMAANEALIQQSGLSDALVMEVVMAHNGDLVLGEVEMSPAEMRGYMAEKITIPINVETENA